MDVVSENDKRREKTEQAEEVGVETTLVNLSTGAISRKRDKPGGMSQGKQSGDRLAWKGMLERRCPGLEETVGLQPVVFYLEVEMEEPVPLAELGKAVERMVKETLMDRCGSCDINVLGYRSPRRRGSSKVCAVVVLEGGQCVAERLEGALWEAFAEVRSQGTGSVLVELGPIADGGGERGDAAAWWFWLGTRRERARPQVLEAGSEKFEIRSRDRLLDGYLRPPWCAEDGWQEDEVGDVKVTENGEEVEDTFAGGKVLSWFVKWGVKREEL
ncbi:hypothetical protein MAJ_10844, partial [Metarhizium majus ARSEF 297]